MGDNNLTTYSDGDTIPSDSVNQYKTALVGDAVPRNASGAPTSGAGDLGTSTYPYKKSHVVNGSFFTGQVIMMHDFNGTLTPGQGWMKLNGDVVNLANYDTLHGAGSWATYVVSSTLDGVNLPDMADKYVMGKAATSQDGSAPITAVGNASNQVNIAHTHTVNNLHNHQWLSETGSNPYDYDTFTSAGNAQSLAERTTTGTQVRITPATSGTAMIGVTDPDCYTTNQGNASTATTSSLSTTQSIQPHSIEMQYWIRIV